MLHAMHSFAPSLGLPVDAAVALQRVSAALPLANHLVKIAFAETHTQGIGIGVDPKEPAVLKILRRITSLSPY